MLKCEGYIMFKGRATVTFSSGDQKIYVGTWLYNPNTEYWYINGCEEFPFGTSFARDQVSDMVEFS